MGGERAVNKAVVTGWQSVPLGEAGTWLSGGTPNTSNPAYWDGDIPWISGASLKSFRITESERRLTPFGVKAGSGLVPEGTTLFVVRGMSLKSEFRIGVAARDMAFGQDIKALIPVDGIDPYFLAYAMRAHTDQILRMVEDTSHGTGRLDINRLQELEIRVPPLDEQRRIVAANAAFERRIEAIEAILGKLRTTRAGLRDALVVGPGVALGKVLSDKPKNGYSPSEVPEWTGLQALGLSCLTTEGFVPKQLKRVPNSPLVRRSLLQDGDLLMNRANTREFVGLAGRYRNIGCPCIYPDLMMKLRPDETQCLTAYLELVLQTGLIRGAVQRAARGTSESMVKISAAVVEQLRVPLPNVGRQGEIVEAVAAVDRQIEQQAAVVAKLRTVQRSIIEDLLAGRSKVEAA